KRQDKRDNYVRRKANAGKDDHQRLGKGFSGARRGFYQALADQGEAHQRLSGDIVEFAQGMMHAIKGLW
ncbi:hypothetical protein Q6249_29635, partial [Klebsiella pneumoniae]